MQCPHSAWFDYDATNQALRELFDISSNEETAMETHVRELIWSRTQLDANMSEATRRATLSRRAQVVDQANVREWGVKRSLKELGKVYVTLDDEAEAARKAGQGPDCIWGTVLGRKYEGLSLTDRQLRVKELLEKEIENMQQVEKIVFDD
ncbi:hypothetical protein BDU57DRAFT_581017 [Ampelomyces quisqualis]|uniref:Uncharacterized protein n=1 Tax=Ampelomyces quisqualis TaxID=50730 RepID=A0A6A5QF89_AMPQU|nr:hypothetical protein BDU57DRAFT_581017 [Ampelomyces quisqualis]